MKVYAGTDPLTGKRLYLRESTTDEREAEKLLTRLQAQVDAQKATKTRGTFGAALDQWFPLHDVEDSTKESYELYIRRYIRPTIGDEPIGKVTALVLESLYAQLRRCRACCDGKPRVDHRVEGPHECHEVKHKRRPGRPPVAGYPPHDCAQTGCKVIECPPHVCKPLEDTSILKIHFIISSVFAAAIRWGWVDTNPAEVAKKPKQPNPQPEPPTSEQAARIVEQAWTLGEMWGTLVWLVMVTGMRRGELVALRWQNVELDAGFLNIRRRYVRANGKLEERPATKNHQIRRIALDPATIELLRQHRATYEDQMRQLGAGARDDAFVFSYEPTCDRPCDPDGLTHKYAAMCASVGIDSHLHALRHYAATELLTSGVDVRTVAGRLGHAGGGATTLRVYAAWKEEADRHAAAILGGRMKRPDLMR